MHKSIKTATTIGDWALYILSCQFYAAVIHACHDFISLSTKFMPSIN